MNRNIIYLPVGSFLTGTVALVISGIIYVTASVMHISAAMAGQLITIFSFSSAIGAPIAIMYTAKWERKKVLLSALILFVIGNALTAASSHLLLLLLARIFLGISGGAYLIVAMSMASQLAVPEKTGNAISIIMTGFSSSLVLGVPLGVLMTNWMNWRWIFLQLALVTLLIIAGIARLVPKIKGHASASFKKSLSLFSNGTVISALFLSLFWIMGYYAVYTYLTPFLKNNVHMDTTMISAVLLILGVFPMIGSRFGGYSSDRFGTTRTLVLCLLIHALSLICLPLLIGSLMSTVIGLVIWMCAAWMTGPSTQTYFVQEVPESSELALSLNTSVLQLGSALGAGFGGVVVNSTASTAHNPLIGGCVVILGLIAALVPFSIRSKAAVENR